MTGFHGVGGSEVDRRGGVLLPGPSVVSSSDKAGGTFTNIIGFH